MHAEQHDEVCRQGDGDSDTSVCVCVTRVCTTPPEHAHTNSVNRAYADLQHGLFLWYAFVLCAARTAVQHPLNLALTRKQTCARASAQSTCAVLRRIHTHEGSWRGLLCGLPALTLACAASEVVYLFLFEYARERAMTSSPATRDAMAAYVADAACRCVHIPLSIVAFRQMSSPQTYTTTTTTTTTTATARRAAGGQRSGRVHGASIQQVMRGMYGERGVRTFFVGYGTTLSMGCVWTAAWWAVYGQAKAVLYAAAAPHLDVLQKQQQQQQQSSSSSCLRLLPTWCVSSDDNVCVNACASVLASSSTAVLFNPYLVVRTNLQVTARATLWSTVRQLYTRRGVRGFYGGLSLNVASCIVDGALASLSYEYAKLWSDKTRKHASCTPTTATTTTRTMPGGVRDAALTM